MTRNNFRKKKYWRNVIRSKHFGASQKEIQKQMFSKQLERQSFSDLKEFLFFEVKRNKIMQTIQNETQKWREKR